MKLNRQEMADLLAVDPTTLDRWVRQGCPVIEKAGKGRPASFEAGAVVRWYAAREADKALESAEAEIADEALEEWRRRKVAAEAQLRELELARSKGEVVSADHVMRSMRDTLVGGREYVVRHTPGRIARRVIGETVEHKIRTACEDEIRQALHAWADATCLDQIADAGGKVSPEWADGPCPTCIAIREMHESGETVADDG